MKKKITEDMGLQKEWNETAKDIKTIEQLTAFISHVRDDFAHDYGTVVHAISAAMKATFSYMNNSPQGGITGCQAGFLGWEMIGHFFGNSDSPLRLIDYNDLLFPQYAHKFTSIPKETADWIKNEATKKLIKGGHAAPTVVEHWRKLANGEIPFGLKIGEGGN